MDIEPPRTTIPGQDQLWSLYLPHVYALALALSHGEGNQISPAHRPVYKTLDEQRHSQPGSTVPTVDRDRQSVLVPL